MFQIIERVLNNIFFNQKVFILILIIISKIDILKKKNGFCSEMTKYYVDLFYWKGINFNSY